MYLLYLVISSYGEDLLHKPDSNSISNSPGVNSKFFETIIFWSWS